MRRTPSIWALLQRSPGCIDCGTAVRRNSRSIRPGVKTHPPSGRYQFCVSRLCRQSRMRRLPDSRQFDSTVVSQRLSRRESVFADMCSTSSRSQTHQPHSTDCQGDSNENRILCKGVDAERGDGAGLRANTGSRSLAGRRRNQSGDHGKRRERCTTKEGSAQAFLPGENLQLVGTGSDPGPAVRSGQGNAGHDRKSRAHICERRRGNSFDGSSKHQQ